MLDAEDSVKLIKQQVVEWHVTRVIGNPYAGYKARFPPSF